MRLGGSRIWKKGWASICNCFFLGVNFRSRIPFALYTRYVCIVSISLYFAAYG